MSNHPTSLYHALNALLKQEHIGLTASELHGLITGLLAGGNNDDSWKILVKDFANNGETFGAALQTDVQTAYQQILESFQNGQFSFQILIDEESDLATRLDDLVGWVNHFLLGLGLMQPKLDKIKGDVGETIADLRQIIHLGYDEGDEEDQEELARSFEEVAEYVRVSAMLCYEELASRVSPAKKVH